MEGSVLNRSRKNSSSTVTGRKENLWAYIWWRKEGVKVLWLPLLSQVSGKQGSESKDGRFEDRERGMNGHLDQRKWQWFSAKTAHWNQQPSFKKGLRCPGPLHEDSEFIRSRWHSGCSTFYDLPQVMLMEARVENHWTQGMEKDGLTMPKST